MTYTHLAIESRPAEASDTSAIEELLREDYRHEEILAQSMGAHCISMLERENNGYFKQRALAIATDTGIDSHLLFAGGDLEALATLDDWTKDDSALYTLGGNIVATARYALGAFKTARRVDVITKDARSHSTTNIAFDVIVPRDGLLYSTIPVHDTEKQRLFLRQSFRAGRTATDTADGTRKTLYVRRD